MYWAPRLGVWRPNGFSCAWLQSRSLSPKSLFRKLGWPYGHVQRIARVVKMMHREYATAFSARRTLDCRGRHERLGVPPALPQRRADGYAEVAGEGEYLISRIGNLDVTIRFCAVKL
jgi:hypothetical protein